MSDRALKIILGGIMLVITMALSFLASGFSRWVAHLTGLPPLWLFGLVGMAVVGYGCCKASRHVLLAILHLCRWAAVKLYLRKRLRRR